MSSSPRLFWSIVLLAVAFAVNAADEWVLFVDSSPPGAEVYLGDELVEGTTPLLIRSNLPGPLVISVLKNGYDPFAVDIDPASGDVSEIVPKLSPSGISLSLPRNDTALIAGNPVTAGDSVIQFTSDRILLNADNGGISVEPSPNLQRLSDALSIAAPIALGFATFLTADAVRNPPADGPAFPPTVVAIQSVSVALIGLDIWAQVAKQRRLGEFRVAVEDRGDPVREAAMLRDADDRLGSGDLDGALAGYDALISEFPSSGLVPAALHRSAGLKILLGDTAEAEVRFSRLVTDLPVAEYHDSSLKNLADIAVRNGEYKAGLEYLSRIVYFKAPFTEEEILEYVREISAAWGETTDTAEEETRILFPSVFD